MLLAGFGMRSWSGQAKRSPKHTSKSEVTRNEGAEEKKRDRGWWNGERKSLDGDLWPHVFLFSFTLLFAPYVSFLILLTDSLCPAPIWPQAVISATFPGVSWRPWRQRGQSEASVHLSVNISGVFKTLKPRRGFIKEQVLCLYKCLIFLIVVLCFCWLANSNLRCMKKLFLWTI